MTKIALAGKERRNGLQAWLGFGSGKMNNKTENTDDAESQI